MRIHLSIRLRFLLALALSFSIWIIIPTALALLGLPLRGDAQLTFDLLLGLTALTYVVWGAD